MVFYDIHMPDVHVNTHIIGLCGSDDPNPIPGADGSGDGWIYSDFFMVNHMLRGLGKSQAWFTSRKPQDLVKKFGEYHHGNQYIGCRVVLDEHQQPDPLTLRIHPADYLRDAFVKYLTQTCQQASKASEPVLLCIFGHSNEDTYEIFVASYVLEDDFEPQVSIIDLLPILDANRNLQMTLLMTSCYSGGWAIVPDLAAESGRRVTAMNAAGPGEETVFWPESLTVGRQAGSLYISAILNTLQKTTTETDTGQSTVSYTTRQFGDEISYQLKHVVDPRFGSTHQAQFTVQDDQWIENYHKRTGIALQHYQARLRQLRQTNPRPITNPRLNRSATIEELEVWEQNPETEGRHTFAVAMGAFGGSTHALRRQIRLQVINYLASHPGRSTVPSNMAVHHSFNACVAAPESLTGEDWEMIWERLYYRKSMMHIAQLMLRKAGVEYARGREWDDDEWTTAVRSDRELSTRFEAITKYIQATGLFPGPTNTYLQGRKWRKPDRYLAAALSESQLELDQVEMLLQKAGREVEITAITCAEVIRSKNYVAYQDGTWWASMKRRS